MGAILSFFMGKKRTKVIKKRTKIIKVKFGVEKRKNPFQLQDVIIGVGWRLPPSTVRKSFWVWISVEREGYLWNTRS